MHERYGMTLKGNVDRHIMLVGTTNKHGKALFVRLDAESRLCIRDSHVFIRITYAQTGCEFCESP
eukprot:scaffold663925_cov75-Prasinocladus_malaysianus.AAC.1